MIKGTGPLWFNHPFKESVLKEAMDQEIDFARGTGIVLLNITPNYKIE